MTPSTTNSRSRPADRRSPTEPPSTRRGAGSKGPAPKSRAPKSRAPKSRTPKSSAGTTRARSAARTSTATAAATRSLAERRASARAAWSRRKGAPSPSRSAASRPTSGERAGIDPRIRERRVAVARRQGRRRLSILLGSVALGALVIGAWFILHSSQLSAKVITVRGSSHASATQVIDAGGLGTHPALIGINPGAVAAKIEVLPWVATASVSRAWPDGVVVSVVERTPTAVVARTGGGWAEVDHTGRVLADVTAPPAGMVHLGVPKAPGAPGTELSAGDRAGLEVAASLPPAFIAQVAAVNVAADGTVQLALTTPVTVELGNTAQLPAKYEDVASLLAGASLHTGDVIDVSVPESPTVTSS